LELYHIEKDYLLVHAGVAPGVPIEGQGAEDFLWIRNEFLRSKAHHGHCIVHVHSIVDMPEFLLNRIAIGTGAYYIGRLTCLMLEGDERRFMQTLSRNLVSCCVFDIRVFWIITQSEEA
jgi:serine/threonine protein phosphatase 1